MNIKSTLTNRFGKILNVEYRDVNDESELKNKEIAAVHAYCFCGDKLVIVYSDAKGYWTPPGGSVEIGESPYDAIRREIKEETNMKVLNQRILGYQDISEPQAIVSQARYVCIVEPYGDFVSDLDGDVTEIKLIKPEDVLKYFSWGEIGDHILKLAIEAKKQLGEEIRY